jgi:hypothetical protein
MNRNLVALAIAATLGLANGALAQSTSAVVGSGPGSVVAARTTSVSATVTAIDLVTRQVTLRGPRGNEFTVVAGNDVRNLAQVRVGDLVTVEYVDALTLDLKKGGTGAGASRTESTGTARAELGSRPGAATAREVTIIADVVALDAARQTVSLRGPKGNVVELPVRDPEQFRRIAVGDQVEANYVEAVAVGVTPAVAPAAPTSVAPSLPNQRKPFSAMLFLWGSAVDADFKVTDPRNGNSTTISTDASFSKLLDNLDAAFMIYGDWTSGRWSVFGDYTYTKVSPSADPSKAVGITSIDTSLKTQIGDIALAYQVWGDNGTRVEVFGGARYYNLNNSATLHEPAREFSASSKQDWWDAVGGVRARTQLAPRWVGVAQGDFGGGGSDRSWQLWGYVGYEFDWGQIGAGWRYLNFSRHDTDMAFNGPILGVVAKF